jgi:hypothetical protein
MIDRLKRIFTEAMARGFVRRISWDVPRKLPIGTIVATGDGTEGVVVASGDGLCEILPCTVVREHPRPLPLYGQEDLRVLYNRFGVSYDNDDPWTWTRTLYPAWLACPTDTH